MELPDLESLACVDALARTLRFSIAARSRFLSAAAFGKRVQQAEAQLGVVLFERTTRKVTLSEAGMALLPRLRELLGRAEALAGAGAGGPVPVELTLGTRHELGMSWLFPARRALMQSMPHVTLHLRFGDTEELERALLTLRADAIVTSHAPSTARLEVLPLVREDYAFVAAPRLLARNPFARPADAPQHVLVDLHDDLPLFSYLRATGLPLRFHRVLSLGTIEAARQAVRDGEGVAVLPRYYVEGDLDKGRLARLLPRAKLAHDFFRLGFRADDARRPLFAAIAQVLASRPLR